MPKLPGINHLQAIRALEKRGFRIIRQGKHVILSDGTRTLIVPRNNPINPFTMGYIVKEAGMTIEEFRRLLRVCYRIGQGRAGRAFAFWRGVERGA